MSHSVETARLAAFLRTLKSRMDRSYEALAKRTGVSSSALHRYCAGTSVPADYGVVRHFAVECGATQQELRELHRLWTLADSVRRGHPAQGAAVTPSTPGRMTLFAVAALAAMAGAAAWRVSTGQH